MLADRFSVGAALTTRDIKIGDMQQQVRRRAASSETTCCIKGGDMQHLGWRYATLRMAMRSIR